MLIKNQILQQGRYQITNPPGQNGTNPMYEAYDNVLQTKVFLVEIPDILNKVTTASQLENRRLAFAEKALALTQIKHQSLLQVQHYFSEIDRHYLVLEHADGNSLSEFIEKQKSPFSYKDTANWAIQLLEAVQYLHALNPPALHCDIKPQNIRLTSEGKVKLLMLEITRNPDEKINPSAGNQQFDAVTLAYSPLEQIWEGLDPASQKVILNSFDEKSEKILVQPADARTDIYALGATLYYLMTARLPVDSLTRSIDVLEGKDDPLPSPNKLNRNIPPEVSNVLMKALEIKREDRFSSAIIMSRVLQTAIEQVKEREAKEAHGPEEENVLEIPPAISYDLPVPERPINKQIETEQKRQIELIKQQLREAKAQRLAAEQRAAEAERLLREKEAKAASLDSAVVSVKSEKDSNQTVSPVFSLPETKQNTVPQKNYSDEYESLFAEPQRENKTFRRMAAGAVVLLILGGAGFGLWSFLMPPSTETKRSSLPVNQPSPVPTFEATPLPAVETTSVSETENTSENESSNSTPEVTKTSGVTPESKDKTYSPEPVQPPQVAKKQPKPTPKTTENKKKNVTLDDLINDN